MDYETVRTIRTHYVSVMATYLPPPVDFHPPLEGVLSAVLREARRLRFRAAPPRLQAGVMLHQGLRIVRPLTQAPGQARFLAQDNQERRFVLELLSPIANLSDATLRQTVAGFRQALRPGMVPLVDAGWLDHRAYLLWSVVLGQPLRSPEQANPRPRVGLEPNALVLSGGLWGPLEKALATLADLHAGGWVHGDIAFDDVLLHESGQTWIDGWGKLLAARFAGDPTPDPRVDLLGLQRWLEAVSDTAKITTGYRQWLAQTPRATASTALDWVRQQAPSKPIQNLQYLRTNVLPPQGVLVGRTGALGRLDAWWQGGTPVATITGPAGMGKSRLAIEWATRGLRDDLVGLTCVDVSDIPEGGIARHVLSAMHIEPGPASARDVLMAFLRRTPRHLIVLDNCEVRLAEVVATLGHWLVAFPDLRCIVTSRESLGAGFEWVLPLESLDTEGPSSEAVQLFTHRAERVLGNAFDGDEDSLVKLVTELDGLPLAIELAAARVGLLPLDEMLSRLSARFVWLRSTKPGRSPRQASLRGALEVSWELLDPTERSGLIQLAVFQGSFTLEDAESVIRGDDAASPASAIDWLERLVEGSWVSAGPQRGRFRLLKSFRVFVLPHLERAPTVSEIRTRHAQRFARLGEPRRWLLDVVSPSDRADAWAELTAARTHVESFDEPGQYHRLAILIRTGCVRIDALTLGGVHTESLSQDLPEPLEAEPDVGVALLLALGEVWLAKWKIDRASMSFERAYAIATDAGLVNDAALVLTRRGWLSLKANDITTAETHLGGAYAWADSIDDPLVRGSVLGYWGAWVGETGRERESQALRAKAIEAVNQVGSPSLVGRFRLGMSYSLYRLGELDEAAAVLEQLVDQSRRLGYLLLEADVLQKLARVEMHRENFDAAAAHLDRCEGVLDTPGHRARILEGRGELEYLRGAFDKARLLLIQASQMTQRAIPWRSHLFLALVELRLGNAAAAIPHLDEVRPNAVGPSELMFVNVCDGLVAVQLGQMAQANAALDRIVEVLTETPLSRKMPSIDVLFELAAALRRPLPDTIWLETSTQ